MNNTVSSTSATQMFPPAIESASRDSAITRAYMGVHADKIACCRDLGIALGGCGALASIIAGSVLAVAGSPCLNLGLAAGVPAVASAVGCILTGVCNPHGHPGYDYDKHNLDKPDNVPSPNRGMGDAG